MDKSEKAIFVLINKIHNKEINYEDMYCKLLSNDGAFDSFLLGFSAIVVSRDNGDEFLIDVDDVLRIYDGMFNKIDNITEALDDYGYFVLLEDNEKTIRR